MKNVYVLLVVFFVSCNTYKQADKELNKGNFDEAFDLVLKKYQKGVKSKDMETAISLLQESYTKANEQDFDIIQNSSYESTNSKYEKMYYAYQRIHERQLRIKPLLPIEINEKMVRFDVKDISFELEQSKRNYADYLYASAESKMQLKSKNEYRNAYYSFTKVKGLIKDYPLIDLKIEESEYLGTNFILMRIENQSFTMLPYALDNDLRRMDTYGLNEKWNVFHTQQVEQVQYDFVAKLILTHIAVSPERMNENRFVKEKSIKDGQIAVRDQSGNIVRDSLGRAIMQDKYIQVACEIRELHQVKEAFINARMEITNPNRNEIIRNEYLDSKFVFEDYSARINGDERALDDNYFRRVKRNPVPFPSSEQMIFDCGQDLKDKMKYILERVF